MAFVKMSAEDMARLFDKVGNWCPLPYGGGYVVPAPLQPYPAINVAGSTTAVDAASSPPAPEHEAGRALDSVAGHRPLPLPAKPVRVPPPLPDRAYGAMLRGEWSPFGAL